MQFKDRFHAGRLLAAQLAAYRDPEDVIILALPRGGVAVGYEVAVELQAPLDVMAVRKVGLPGYSEMAIGALAWGGIENIPSEMASHFHLSTEDLKKVVAEERQELSRQEHLFRNGRPFPALHDKAVILVDDGLATGHTMKAAILAVRNQGPKELVVAIPVGPGDTCQLLARDVNHLVCLFTPTDFISVGAYYRDFRQVPDDEVIRLLKKAGENRRELTQP
jgi:putative phosphoribosyl transferase